MIVAMFSTLVAINEGKDVAASAAKITDGFAFSRTATRIGWRAAAIGVVILVPSALVLNKENRGRTAANQAADSPDNAQRPT
jgi:hypothetical protein